LSSAASARWMRSHIPGVHIPDDVIDRLDRAADPRAEGARICIELLQAIRSIDGVSGAHIMAYRREQEVPEIIDRAGILAGRELAHPL
jgi:methylenetetrahydrofolate reductase (NADPH)